MRTSSTLAFVDLSAGSIDDEVMRALGTALLDAPSSSLVALRCDAFELPRGATACDLSRRQLGPAAATLLAGLLKFNGTLTDLELRDNPLGAEGVAAIARALHSNTTLASLTLAECRMCGIDLFGNGRYRADGVHTLLEAVNRNQALTVIDIAQANFGRAERKVRQERVHRTA